MTRDEHAADRRRDDVEEKRELHLLLPDDCREGEGGARSRGSYRRFAGGAHCHRENYFGGEPLRPSRLLRVLAVKLDFLNRKDAKKAQRPQRVFSQGSIDILRTFASGSRIIFPSFRMTRT